jgi:hypothetical protein
MCVVEVRRGRVFVVEVASAISSPSISTMITSFIVFDDHILRQTESTLELVGGLEIALQP